MQAARQALKAMLALGLVILSGCSAADNKPLQAVTREVFDFTTLGEMTATSDFVVEAVVTGVERGRTVGPPDHGRIQFREVTLTVQKTYFGSATGPAVVLNEEGWEDGRLVIMNGLQPSAIGDRGVFFLQAIPNEPGQYTLLSSQGRLLFDAAANRVVGKDGNDPLVDQMETLTPDQVRAQLEDAVQRIRRGEIKKVEPKGPKLASPTP